MLHQVDGPDGGDASADDARLVRVRFFGGARAAAGVPSASVAPGSVADLTEALSATFGDRLARVLGVASLLVDGRVARDPRLQVQAGSTVDVLPPFAGG